MTPITFITSSDNIHVHTYKFTVSVGVYFCQSQGHIYTGMMESKKKKVIQRSRQQLGGNFALNKSRRQSKRFGHPSRPIVRPRKYVTTSSSDIDKVNTSRNDNCGLDQTVDIENDINQIRNGLDINKENEAASINTQDVSPSMVNNCSIQLINPVEQLYSPLNVTGTSEQCSVPQKTYAELLPLRSTSGFNTGQAIYGLSQQSPCVTTTINQQVTSAITSSQTGQAIYGLSQPSPCVTTTNQQEYPTRLTPATRIHSNKSGHSNDGSRDKEVWRMYEKSIDVVLKEEFQCLRKELYEYHQTINNKLDKLLRKRTDTMPPKPPSFPLQSVQEVTDFNNISQEEYENAVQYLQFIGGFTLHDTIKYCMKEAMTDETIIHYSAWGERGNLPLFDTKVIKVIYDAVCMNSHFQRLLRDEFFREVAEAVRFGKQRNRNVRRVNRGERGRRQRLRIEADNHLLGELQNAQNVDEADNGDYN